MTIKKEWFDENEKLSEEIEKYSTSYKCEKCENNNPGVWCEHLLKARYRKFRRRIIGQINSLGTEI